MRAVVCCVAFVVAACDLVQLRAQNGVDPSASIEWSPTRRLTVKDFRGRIPSRATEASLSAVAIEASWECEDGKGSSRATAVFDPNRSWWKEPSRNIWRGADDPSLVAPRDDNGSGLLGHEQVHFDLTEVWARKIREMFKTLPTVCKTPGAAREFEKTIADMEHDWQDEQKRYDRETDHGMDAARQKAWTVRAASALKEN